MLCWFSFLIAAVGAVLLTRFLVYVSDVRRFRIMVPGRYVLNGTLYMGLTVCHYVLIL